MLEYNTEEKGNILTRNIIKNTKGSGGCVSSEQTVFLFYVFSLPSYNYFDDKMKAFLEYVAGKNAISYCCCMEQQKHEPLLFQYCNGSFSKKNILFIRNL